MKNFKASRHIRLLDTTLRDGEQTQGVSFSANEKVNIARSLLQSLKVDRIEVASACVSEGEQNAVAKICQWAKGEGLVDKIEILGFVDYRRSVDWIIKAGGTVINLLAKGSEKHCREQLGKDLTSHINDIERTVEYAKEKGVRVKKYVDDDQIFDHRWGVVQHQRNRCSSSLDSKLTMTLSEFLTCLELSIFFKFFCESIKLLN